MTKNVTAVLAFAAFARYNYDAYGNITGEQLFTTALISGALAQAITDIQPLRYAGYVLDPESGLYYCSQRYFDPDTGAFISKDPAKADGELSAYSYCGTDPINYVDPSGLIFTMAEASSYYYNGNKKADDAQLLMKIQAQTLANNNIKAGSYNTPSGKKSCTSHIFKGTNGTYTCINCYGVFDSKGEFLRVAVQGNPNVKLAGMGQTVLGTYGIVNGVGLVISGASVAGVGTVGAPATGGTSLGVSALGGAMMIAGIVETAFGAVSLANGIDKMNAYSSGKYNTQDLSSSPAYRLVTNINQGVEITLEPDPRSIVDAIIEKIVGDKVQELRNK